MNDRRPEPRTVSVKVSLIGGHTRTLELSEDAPQLRELLTALANPEGAGLVQLPLEGGAAAFSFPATSLVSVVTEPPVVVDVDCREGEDPPTPASAVPGAEGCVVVDEFLPPDERQEMLDWALAHEHRCVPGAVSSGDSSSRRNLVIAGFGGTARARKVENRLLVHYPLVARHLGLPVVPLERAESQLTAGNDGDYFLAHADDGADPETVSRYLTCVYYFFRDPKGFDGGNLRLYADASHGESASADARFREIDVVDNRLVVFPSGTIHEILPVRCSSGVFADSRFAVSCWLHRAEDPMPEATLGRAHFRFGKRRGHSGP